MKTDYLVMTPGPTMVAKNVREARAIPCTNPDIDEDFVEVYVDTCKKISSLLFTQNETLILSGEGILGLEAACASLTEENDRVLVIDNGIYATVVHCDTPSGMLNDIKRICPLLKSYGILTVVDSVSGMFGNEVKVDEWKIDILCGGSQKALSAPVELTFVTISEAAKKVIYNRMTPVKSFYGNLANFKNYYKDKWFPYTMPISDICGLHEAVLNIKPDTINRHKKIAAATRYALTKSGLKLYQKSGFSDTVTVFMIPKGTSENEILSHMKDKNILLTGSFDYLRGKVIRIGHMGENATKQNIITVFEALDKTFIEINVPMKESLKENFVEWLKIN